MSRRGSIPLDSIAFYDNVLPPLGAGDYTINASQEVVSTDAAHPLSQSFSAAQSFSVVAPRFALPDADIQSRFPPRDAAGMFHQNLPHVVFNERVLPWERPLVANDKTIPWLALLLFTEDEILPPGGAPATIANPTLAGSYPVAELLKPAAAATLGPKIIAQAKDETTCNAIDITTRTFTKVTPRLAELPYLAHAREVNVDGKATSIATAGGWFSVVIANRFPTVDANAIAGTRNIAHLVSLEGFADYLTDTPSWPAGIANVRLASLASWSFTCKTRGGNFRQLMLGLTADQPKGGDGLRLRLPIRSGVQQPESDLVEKSLRQGYAALQYETRVGDHSFAWYHGPFVPQPIASFSGMQPFASSAAATIYDEDTGTFDLTYATAWELGRLLALSDRAYSTNQVAARKSLRRTINLARERSALRAEGRTLDAVFEPNAVSASFVEWLGEAGPDLLPKPGLDAVQPPEPQAPLADDAPAVVQVRSLHADSALHALLAHHVASGGNGQLDEVTKWLGKLRLLAGVPFVDLLADERMLPVDSIRFFHVDNNYLDALCDGAASVGVHTSRDAAEQLLMRPLLRESAVRHAHTLRAKAIGREELLKNPQPNDPMAGLLLRSAVVSGWPGLEVKAFANRDGVSAPVDIIRFDHLGDDVLLVLFAQVPAWVEIDEPREALAFGVEDDDVVELRALSGPNIGKVTGAHATLTSDYKRDGSRVVNVGAWQQSLAKALGSPPSWGPASFAIEMVRAPQQMVFRNSASAAMEADHD